MPVNAAVQVTFSTAVDIASVNATLQTMLAAHFGGNYGLALAIVAGTVAIVIAGLTAAGVEAKGVSFSGTEAAKAAA